MMTIKIGEKPFNLRTNLGVAVKLEKQFGKNLLHIMDTVQQGDIVELLQIIGIGANTDDREAIEAGILEHWDYFDVSTAVQELLLRTMYSGTPEQIEAKLDKNVVSESQKNAIRELLGLPIKTADASTQSNSSAPATV